MSGRTTFIHGNALSLPLADQSVHLICTSPPYFALRSYRDGDEHFDGQIGSEESPLHFLAALWRVMDECWRVLRDDGNLWLNLGDKFAGAGPQNAPGRLSSVGNSKHWAQVKQATTGLRSKSKMLLPHLFAVGCQMPWFRRAVEQEAGLPLSVDAPQWIVRMDAVWSKPNGLPESVTDRVRASHEFWFHLVKSERYFAALDEIREEHAEHSLTYYGEGKPGRRSSSQATADWVKAQGRDPATNGLGYGRSTNPLGKLPGSVWEVATEPLRLPDHLPQHFAAFPSEFPRRIVLGWSPSGVCVVCGEPRRPVCESTKVSSRPGISVKRRGQPLMDNGGNQANEGRAGDYERSITGYACACPSPDAPTTPATVLDPFSGTGTTAIVAAALGRHGIGVDLSWDYQRIARWRDEDGRLALKAAGMRPKPKRKPKRRPDTQGALF